MTFLRDVFEMSSVFREFPEASSLDQPLDQVDVWVRPAQGRRRPALFTSMSDAESQDGGVGDGRSSTGCAGLIYVPLDHKVRVCKLCSHKSNEKSPLLHDRIPSGGFRPWKYYKKSEDGESKLPEGRYCLICANVFKALGAPEHITTLIPLAGSSCPIVGHGVPCPVGMHALTQATHKI